MSDLIELSLSTFLCEDLVWRLLVLDLSTFLEQFLEAQLYPLV